MSAVGNNSYSQDEAPRAGLSRHSAQSATEEISRKNGSGRSDHQQGAMVLFSEAHDTQEAVRKYGPVHPIGGLGSHMEANRLSQSLSASNGQSLVVPQPAATLMAPLISSEIGTNGEGMELIRRINARIQWASREVEALESSSAAMTLRFLHHDMSEELGTLYRMLQNTTIAAERPRRQRNR